MYCYFNYYLALSIANKLLRHVKDSLGRETTLVFARVEVSSIIIPELSSVGGCLYSCFRSVDFIMLPLHIYREACLIINV